MSGFMSELLSHIPRSSLFLLLYIWWFLSCVQFRLHQFVCSMFCPTLCSLQPCPLGFCCAVSCTTGIFPPKLVCWLFILPLTSYWNFKKVFLYLSFYRASIKKNDTHVFGYEEKVATAKVFVILESGIVIYVFFLVPLLYPLPTTHSLLCLPCLISNSQVLTVESYNSVYN